MALSELVMPCVVPCLQRCTTSYVKLPPDYPKLQCSHRTPLASLLVNDIWVSVTSGSEDYSFKVSHLHSVDSTVVMLI